MPLKIGATSYVVPGGLVENARHLAGQVADMELVLFDLPGGPSNVPSAAEVRELAAIGAECGLSYTVHLPADLPGQPVGAPLDPILAQAARIIELTQPLSPYAYIFHLDGMSVRSPQTPPEQWAAWQAAAVNTLTLMAQWVDTHERLALENVEGYPLEFLDPLLAAVPVVRCVDVGHLWVDGHDPLPYLCRWLPRTHVVHLHGVAGRDHRSLQHTPVCQLEAILDLLAQDAYDGIVTLEVFEEDFATSLAAVQRVLKVDGV